MQRKENESFADYKVRRAYDNAAIDRLNYQANNGGKYGTRAQLRENLRRAGGGKIRGTYGQNLLAHFARQKLAEIQNKKDEIEDKKWLAKAKTAREDGYASKERVDELVSRISEEVTGNE